MEEIQRSYLEWYSSLYQKVESKNRPDYSANDAYSENIVHVKEEYTITDFWRTSEDGNGNLLYAEIYSLYMENLVGVPKSLSRTMPYRLNYPNELEHEIRIEFPEEWVIDTEASKLTGPGFSYDYSVNYDASTNRCILRHHYQSLKAHLEPAEVEDHIAQHDEILNNLSYVITYDQSFDQFRFSWPAGFLVIAVLGFGVYGAKRIYEDYDPRPQSTIIRSEGIGGWLVLPAIGLFLSPFTLLIGFTQDYSYFNQSVLESLLDPASISYNPLFGLVMVLELIFQVLQLVFSCLLILLFVQRRSSLPRLITLFYGGILLFNVSNILVVEFIGLEVGEEAISHLLAPFIAAAVWIPYFQVSKRVKRTFVKQINPAAGTGGEIKAEILFGHTIRPDTSSGKVKPMGTGTDWEVERFGVLKESTVIQGLTEGWLMLDDRIRRGDMSWARIRIRLRKKFDVLVLIDPVSAYANRCSKIGVGAGIASVASGSFLLFEIPPPIVPLILIGIGGWEVGYLLGKAIGRRKARKYPLPATRQDPPPWLEPVREVSTTPN